MWEAYRSCFLLSGRTYCVDKVSKNCEHLPSHFLSPPPPQKNNDILIQTKHKRADAFIHVFCQHLQNANKVNKQRAAYRDRYSLKSSLRRATLTSISAFCLAALSMSLRASERLSENLI